MSYLVDALKKAERERHEQRGADLQSLSAGDGAGHGRRTTSALRWIVIALVVCNLGLLLYLLVPDVRDASAEGGETNAAATPAVASAPAPGANHAQAPVAAAAPQPGPVTSAQARGRRQDDDQRPDQGRPQREAQRLSGLHMSDGARSARGRVTYSQTPLDDNPALPPSNQEGAPAMQDLGGAVPQVSINGHLYSSVPGRSFILINGRRYHEGERLTAGPAVESIDATGATLNFRGQRYHVNGPG